MTKADRRARTHQNRLLATAALGLALTGLAGTAHAADPVTLTIVDRDTGQPLQVWNHDGRLYVAGQPGAGYCLRVTNHTGRRVLAVLSVDGVNIYTGQTAGYGQGGYVFNPYESYAQCGWRKSLSEVAAFSFTALPDSYAARTGRPAEVGVVGMAVFYERVDPPAAAAPTAPPSETPLNLRGLGSNRTAAPPPIQQRDVPPPPEPGPPPPPPITIKPQERVVVPPPPRPAPPSALAAQAAPRTEKLGTAHGALETSIIHQVDFNRATQAPAYVRQIEYDFYENLAAAGVIPPVEHQPQAFPSRPRGFVPDPPPQR